MKQMSWSAIQANQMLTNFKKFEKSLGLKRADGFGSSFKDFTKGGGRMPPVCAGGRTPPPFLDDVLTLSGYEASITGL